MIHEIVLHLFVELILSSIKVLSLLPKYPLYHLLSKIHEYVGRYELYPCLNVVLDCLTFVSLSLVKCMLSNILFELTLMSYDNA